MRLHRPRLLYLMHVDWKWIKQRPQFIAEELSSLWDVQVVCRRHVRQHGRVPNMAALKVNYFAPVPRRFGRIARLADTLINRMVISLFVLWQRPHTIWVTYPYLRSYIPAWARRRVRLVYDCMDDALQFDVPSAVRSELVRVEHELCQDADLVLASSTRLGETLRQRYQLAYTPHLVRNGISARIVWDLQEQDADEARMIDAEPTRDLRLLYFGTIAEWFDFSAVLHLLARCPDVSVHLVGPSVVRIPKHPRLVHHGVVEHARLRAFAVGFDVFIMPFEVTPLIESVDPVKLYEYLAFGRETVSVFYPEIRRFGEFVHFYQSPEELVDVIEAIRAGRTRSTGPHREAVTRFLADNTWHARVMSIQGMLLSDLTAFSPELTE